MSAFRGFFALNGFEIANSSRAIAHLNVEAPLSDVGLIHPIGRNLKEDPEGSGLYIPASYETPPGSGLYDADQWDFTIVESGPGELVLTLPFTVPAEIDHSLIGSGLYQTGECSLVEYSKLLYEIPATAEPSADHPGLYTPAEGSELYSPGLIQIDDGCWDVRQACSGCRPRVNYDDSWTGLAEFLEDGDYRVELAPWHSVELPESGEFLGVWVMDATGLGPITVRRNITELIGAGAIADMNHDSSRVITFDALLLACTNAGLEYGLEWLACILRQAATTDESILRFFASHPQHSNANPESLIREVRNVVLTKSPEIRELIGAAPGPHQQATMYRISWEMTATNPYVYQPPMTFAAEWDVIYEQTINWVHGVGCKKPVHCDDFPTLFSKTCVPEVIDLPNQPPLVCGGCMPLSSIWTYMYDLPTFSYPRHCNETAINMTIKNLVNIPLTFQAYWQLCATDPACEDHKFPLQISGLPGLFDLHLDAVQGKVWAIGYTSYQNPAAPRGKLSKVYREKRWRPVGIVGTPSGAPWRPPIIDREDCWQLVVVAPPNSRFSIELELVDRGA